MTLNIKEYFGLGDDIKSLNDIYIKIPRDYDLKALVAGHYDWNILNDSVTFKQANDPNNYKTEKYPKVRTFVERCIHEIFGTDKEVLNRGEDRLNVDDFSMRATYEEFNISGYCFHLRVASDEDVFLDDLILPFGWHEMLMMPQKASGGLWLFTGNMGSGKSTTIYAFISEYIRKNGGEAITYEEPVEKILPEEIGMGRIFQNNIPYGADWGHVARRVRRFQPSSTGNIIFIGEINSYETARIAVTSALLGTNVISTIHGASIKDVIHNLRDCLNSGPNANHTTTNNLISQTLRFLSHQKIENNPFSTGLSWDLKKVVGNFLFNPYGDGAKNVSQMLKDEALTSLETVLERQEAKMAAALKNSNFSDKLLHCSIANLTDVQRQHRSENVYKYFIDEVRT